MAYQSTVIGQQAYGIPGEKAFDGPTRCQPYTITSGTEANNVFGRAFTVTSEGVAAAGGTNSFAGILVDPKAAPLIGSGLASSNVLPNGMVGELMVMGEIWVQLPAAAAINDLVYFVQTTGALGTGTAGAGQTQIAGAFVSHYTPTAAGLACITLTK